MPESGEVALLLTGDVMLGRGVDQVLPHPSDPSLYEAYAKSAEDYVHLAAARNGPVRRPVPFDYLWGEALEEIDRRAPDLRIINLETAVTTSATPEDKGINYRMHPNNVPVLAAAHVDVCVLANNHVGDWGRAGLDETLEKLRRAGIATAGAGRNACEAAAPAVLPIPGIGRVLLVALGATTSGVPADWAAREGRAGINLLPDTVEEAVTAVRKAVVPLKAANDIVIASIHWGGNWGYEVTKLQRAIAHGLIERAGVDIVHGHSSHHPRPIETYRDKLVLYGCGDFMNDYEGIAGYEQYRGELSIAYLASVSTKDGTLRQLEMLPFRIRRFRLERAARDDARWLAETLGRESVPFGTGIEIRDQRWEQAEPQGASAGYATLWLTKRRGDDR